MFLYVNENITGYVFVRSLLRCCMTFGKLFWRNAKLFFEFFGKVTRIGNAYSVRYSGYSYLVVAKKERGVFHSLIVTILYNSLSGFYLKMLDESSRTDREH